MKHPRFILAAVIVLFAAVRSVSAAEAATLLNIRFALSDTPEGKYQAAPMLVVAAGETARVQFPSGKTLIDYSFSPTLSGENVRLVIGSHCKDENGHEIPSTLCKAYLLPFDSEVYAGDGDRYLKVTVSRTPAAPAKRG